MKYLKIILFFFFLGFSGCNYNVIDEEKFINVYSDLLIAQDTTSMDINHVQKIVFAKHNITLKEYKKTINYYSEDIERWEVFFKKALQVAENKKK